MKDPEPLLASDATPWEARLLQAARDEEPTAEARSALQRRLGLDGAAAPAAEGAMELPVAARSAASTLVTKWLVLAGAGAALLGGLPWLLRTTSTTKPLPRTTQSTTAQSAHDAREGSDKAAQPALERRPAETQVQVAGEPLSAPASADHGAAHSLAQELASLERVRAALQDAAPARALAQLSAHERRYPHGTLREEALALRWEAVLAHGDRAEAARVARVFLRRYPRSVHAVRIRAQLEQPVDAR